MYPSGFDAKSTAAVTALVAPVAVLIAFGQTAAAPTPATGPSTVPVTAPNALQAMLGARDGPAATAAINMASSASVVEGLAERGHLVGRVQDHWLRPVDQP